MVKGSWLYLCKKKHHDRRTIARLRQPAPLGKPARRAIQSITHPSDWQNPIRRAAVFVWSLASERWVFYTFENVSVALDSGWQEEDDTLLSLGWQLK